MNRLSRIFLAASVLVCAIAHAGQNPEAVRIGMASSPGFISKSSKEVQGTYPTARVIEDGWLEAKLRERGVKLQWVPITGELGPITNEAFASKRIDFANIGDLPSIILNARSTRTQLIVPNGKGADLFLVVPVNSTARTLQDLKGKRVSVQLSRPWELGFRALAREKGLTFADFRNFNLTPQVSTNALALGNIDAVFGIHGYLLEEKKVGRIIWSSRGSLDYKVRSSELWGTRDFLERYPEVSQLIATAYVRAQLWVAQDQAKESAVRRAVLNGTPERVARRSYDDSAVIWRDYWSPLFDDLVTNHYRQAVTFATDTRLINRKLTGDELLQPKFVQTALKDLQAEGFWTPSPSSRLSLTRQARLSTNR